MTHTTSSWRPARTRNTMYFVGGTELRSVPQEPFERHGRREALGALQSGQPMIYAASVAGGLIKIGCTIDVYRRMCQIHGDILGFRFGDRDEEQEIHRSLVAHVHHGREWYYPTPEVIGFVNELREPFGLELLAA